MHKASVRKSQGLYAEAAKELGRVRVWALDDGQLADYYYQQALCGYLAEEYVASLAAVSEGGYYVTAQDDLARLALVESLAAAAVGQWPRSEDAVRRYVDYVYSSAVPAALERELSDYYASAPRLRNPQTAYWLSLLPGVGQIYAGRVWSGVVALAVNGALGAFAVGEVVAAHYLSAWVVGGGLLSQTYFVNMERAYQLSGRRNARLLADHSRRLKDILLSAE